MMNRQAPAVIAVCSGKGGVGKTNVVSNLAVALGQRGQRVLLLDADLGLANVDVLFGLTPRWNLAHVLSGEVDLDSTLIEGPAGVRVVPASSGNFDMTDLGSREQAAIIQAFAGLGSEPDILLVDTPAGISPSVGRFVAAAQHAVVVVCDEPASITDAYALIKVFSQHYGVSRFNVVTNRSRGRRDGARLFDKLVRVTDRFLDVVLRHTGDIPDDRRLQRAVQEQRAVVDAYPASPSAEAFAEMARRIEALPRPRVPSGSIEFFLERVVAGDRRGRERVA